MKVKKWIKVSLATLLASNALVFSPIISARQDAQDVLINFSVKNNLPDFTSQENTSVSFDIINLETSTVVYSYRQGQGNVDNLFLSAGKYRFRLYYWDQISANQGLVNDELIASIIEPTQDELNQGKKEKITTTPGSVNVLGDGATVLDIDFEVKATDYIYNANTGRYEIDWKLFLADEDTAKANDVLHNQTLTSEPVPETQEETPEPVQENKGSLTLKVVDEAGNAIGGIVFNFNGQEVVTDDTGIINLLDLAPGVYPVYLYGMPEAYQGEWYEEVVIEEASHKIIDLRLATKEVSSPSEQASVTFNVVDQQGKGVAGAVISFNDQEYTTDENGQVLVENVAEGVYSYEIIRLPENFVGQNLGQLTVDATLGDHNVSLPVDLAQQVGSVLLTVQDQDQQAIANVSILFNGSEVYTSDENGHININDLAPNTYSYEMNELPQGYKTDTQVFSVDVNQGQVEQTLTLQKAPQTQTVKLQVTDQFSAVVANVHVRVGDQNGVTNENGEVTFSNIVPGQHTYQLTQLPDKFLESYQGMVEVAAGVDLETVIIAERAVAKGKASITVLNQEGHAIPSAMVQFGGLAAETDENGLVVFENLDLGLYYYSVIEAPNSVDLNQVEQSVEITEGKIFEDTLTFNEQLTGTVEVLVKENNGQAIANAKVTVDGQEFTTNDQGKIVIENKAQGTFDFAINNQLGYLFSPQSGQLTVYKRDTTTVEIFGEKEVTTTQAPVTTQAPATTETPTTTQASVTTEVPATTQAPITTVTTTTTQATTTVNQALKQFIDRTTNIEVWVHPDDAQFVERIAINKITNNLPSSIANKDVDVYSVRAIKADGSEMVFTKTVQVKIPTRLVQNQIQLVRINQDQLSSISHSIFNQRVNFTTQMLGQFAIVYGDKVPVTHEETTVSEQTTIQLSVNKTTDTQKRIPATGERASWLLTAVALVTVGLGFFLLRKRKI